ncbi:MAG: hypothetical protein ACFWTZ_07030 [Burkholderia sp.]|jgi:DNA-binding XRE family transcriptional regulator
MARLSESREGGETVFTLRVDGAHARAVRSMLEGIAALLPQQEAEEAAPGQTPGQALRELRRERGLSQAALARKIGVTQMRVSDMEQGVRPISAETAGRIAEAFGVSAKPFLS